MNWPIVMAAVWVVAATIVAFLPMRRQYVPGITLLVLAPLLIVWLGVAHGWWWSVAATLGFVSMFRNPLRYLIARMRGERPELPK